MRVSEIIEKVTTQAIKLGIDKDLLGELMLLELINDALEDLQVVVKPGMKYVWTSTIEDREHYLLPGDVLDDCDVFLDGNLVEKLHFSDYIVHKE